MLKLCRTHAEESANLLNDNANIPTLSATYASVLYSTQYCRNHKTCDMVKDVKNIFKVHTFMVLENFSLCPVMLGYTENSLSIISE